LCSVISCAATRWHWTLSSWSSLHVHRRRPERNGSVRMVSGAHSPAGPASASGWLSCGKGTGATLVCADQRTSRDGRASVRRRFLVCLALAYRVDPPAGLGAPPHAAPAYDADLWLSVLGAGSSLAADACADAAGVGSARRLAPVEGNAPLSCSLRLAALSHLICPPCSARWWMTL
jgi:hypothetical protein